MPNLIFPGATHLFRVSRAVGLIPDPVRPRNKIDGGKQIVIQNLSMQIKPLIGLQMADEAALTNEAKYQGICFSGSALHGNDDLLDEVQMDNNGHPIAYTIVGEPYDNGYYVEVFLKVKAFGG